MRSGSRSSMLQAMSTEHTATVSIDPDGRGAWEVVMPEGRDHVSCATLEAARLLAYRSATDRPPCELIVRDPITA